MEITLNDAVVLIQKQLTVLDEAEKAVQEGQTVVESRRQPLDYWNRSPAEQAAALRERIAKVRATYQELQRELERDQALRAAAK